MSAPHDLRRKAEEAMGEYLRNAVNKAIEDWLSGKAQVPGRVEEPKPRIDRCPSCGHWNGGYCEERHNAGHGDVRITGRVTCEVCGVAGPTINAEDIDPETGPGLMVAAINAWNDAWAAKRIRDR